MSVTRMGASLRFEPERRDEQIEKLVSPRAEIIRAFGDQVWVNITPEQAELFRREGIQVQFYEEAYLVELPSVLFDPLEGGEPQPPPGLSAEPQPGRPAYFLIQFAAPPDPDWITTLEELGGDYVGDVPHFAALFRMTPEQADEARARADIVRWAGVHHPVYALDYRLAGRDTPFSAAELPTARPDPSRFVKGGLLDVQVSIFEDLTTDEVRPPVERAGATVEADTGDGLIVTIRPENLTDLLRIPGVRAVEPLTADRSLRT